MNKLYFILAVILICVLGYFVFPIAIIILKVLIGVALLALVVAGFAIGRATRPKN